MFFDYNDITVNAQMSLLKGAQATCKEIASDMKTCFRLKDMLSFNVL